MTTRNHWLSGGLLATLLLFTPLALADEPLASAPELPRIAPLEPAAALEAFEVAPGYRIELVAAEPLVVDPVAFCFDARGRLVVVEMRGYSERPDDHTGRVRRLTDTDGDGRMDEVETLAEGLSWPTAVACWGDGYLVAVAPDILFIPGTEGDQPGTPEKWFTGFRRDNVQGLVNSLRWGPDNRIHGATSSSGADVLGDSRDAPLRLGRRDFAIDPLTRRFEPVAGGGQHGMSFNRWGDKFVCSNSDHLQQVLLESAPAVRVSHTPPLRRSIAEDGPQADVFRASPVEPWRVLRTRLRVAGTVPGPVEGGGRAAGYFTGATGVYVYDGDQWFDEPVDQALVCDVGSNLVHRKRLTPDGLWWRGSRIDEQSELLRSTDIWFRPVQLGTGPDGGLYIADMYREVIEHPKSLPPQIKSQLDLNSGNDRGRIWRLVATDRPVRRPLEALDRQSSTALVAVLDHPNAWHRRTAARLLYQRQAKETIEPLRRLVREGTTAAGRLQALQTLAGLPDGIDAPTLQAAWRDQHPRVRRLAVRLLGEAADAGSVVTPEQVLAGAEDPSIHVRFQLASHAGTLLPDEAQRAELLWGIARRDAEDPWIRWAVEGSLGSAAKRFVDRVLESPEGMPPTARAAWLRAGVCQLLHTDEDGIAGLVDRLQQSGPSSTDRYQLLSAIAAELRGLSATGRGKPLARWLRQELDPAATDVASGEPAEGLSLEDRLGLLQWSFPAEATQELLAQLLHPSQPIRVQQLALQKLVGNQQGALDSIVSSIGEMTPAVRETAWDVLKGQRRGLDAVAAAVLGGTVEVRAIPDDVRRLLSEQADPLLKKRLAADGAPKRETVPAELIQRYTSAAETPGDAAQGRATFVRICAACHRAGGEGRAVGPDLRSVAEKSNEQLLIAILDPNREVDLRFQTVVLETASGQILAGVVETENDASVTIVDSQGRRSTVQRADIDRLSATGRSLMIEGLHEEISPEVMRDLIAFLRTSDG